MNQNMNDQRNLLTSVLGLTNLEFLEWLSENAPKLDHSLIATGKGMAEKIGYTDHLKSALRLLTRLERIANILSDPSAEALVWRGRANVYQFNERYPQSLRASRRAAAIYRAHGQHFEEAIARIVEVSVLGGLERFAAAIKLAVQIRPVFENSEHELAKAAEAKVTHALAHVYASSWQGAEALAEFKRALALFQRLDESWDVAWVLLNIGILYADDQDQLEQARQYFLAALPVFQEHDDILFTAKTMFNLAEVALRRDEIEQALDYLQQGRDLLNTQPNSPIFGYIDRHEARIRQKLNQLPLAETLARQALRRFEKLSRRIDAAETLSLLAQLLASSRSGLPEALTCLAQATVYFRSLKMPLSLALIQLDEAELLLRLNNAPDAQTKALQALETLTGTTLWLRSAKAKLIIADCSRRRAPERAEQLYHEVLATLDESQALLAARCWQGLGRLAQDASNIPAAEGAYTIALRSLEELRRGLSSHLHKASFQEDKRQLVEDLISIIHRQPQCENKLFYWLERIKAAALADFLVGQPPDASLDTTVQTMLQERERLVLEIDRRLSSLNDSTIVQKESLGQRGSALAAHDEFQSREIAQLRRQLQLIEEQIAQQHNPTRVWREGVTLAAEQVQSLLTSETILISYYTAQNGRLYALTVSHELGAESFQIHDLNMPITEVERILPGLGSNIVQPDERSQRIAQKQLEKLYTLLIAPLARRLTAAQRLIILPHQIIGQVPFAALRDSQGNYLIQRWSVQLAPSATILAWCRQLPSGTLSPLFIGYPGESEDRDRPQYLANVKDEIESLAKLYPTATTKFDQEATYECLMAESPGRQVVHIAGHCYFNPADPLDSSIPLAGKRSLRAADLYLRYGHFQGATIILSGCESGQGHALGYDLLGLISGFLYAGASSIISTLWRIDDSASAEFMTSFYEKWQKTDAATALRDAQLQMLHHATYAAPYYWAPFVLNGDSRSLPGGY